MKSSFQAGVDTLYNKCVSCGSTPSAKTPTAIELSIGGIYTNRYNTGYNAGKSSVSNIKTFSLSLGLHCQWYNSKGQAAGTVDYTINVRYVNGSLSSSSASKSGTSGTSVAFSCNCSCTVSIKSIFWS